MADVFISYSRRNSKFARKLIDRLTIANKDSWVDWEGIPLTAPNWWSEIKAGIEKADNFIFIMSPDSMASIVCNMELDYALHLKKRIIPVVYHDIESREAFASIADFEPDEAMRQRLDGQDPLIIARNNWQSISHINWLFFREQDDFDTVFGKLIETVETDLAYVKAHTRYLTQAQEWQREGKRSDLMLFGEEIERAENWLKQAEQYANLQYEEKVDVVNPLAQELHYDYIRESRKAEQSRKMITRLALFSIIILILVAIVSGTISVNAIKNGNQAATQVAQANLANTESMDIANEANARVTAVQPTLTHVAHQIADGETRLATIESQRLTAVAGNIVQQHLQELTLMGQQAIENGHPDIAIESFLESYYLQASTLTVNQLQSLLVAYPYLEHYKNLELHESPSRIVIEPSGTRIVFQYPSSSDYGLQIIEIESGLVTACTLPTVDNIDGIFFANPNELALIIHNTSILMDVSNCNIVQQIDSLNICPDELDGNCIENIVDTNKTNQVAIIFNDGILKILNTDNWLVETKIAGGLPRGASIAFHPVQDYIAVVGANQTLEIFDLNTGLPVGGCSFDLDNIGLSVSFSPDGAYILASALFEPPRMFRFSPDTQGTCLDFLFDGNEPFVSQEDYDIGLDNLGFITDDTFVIADREGYIRFWSWTAMQEVLKVASERLHAHNPLNSFDSIATGKVINGQRYISAYSDNTFAVWNLRFRQPLASTYLLNIENNIQDVASLWTQPNQLDVLISTDESLEHHRITLSSNDELSITSIQTVEKSDRKLFMSTNQVSSMGLEQIQMVIESYDLENIATSMQTTPLDIGFSVPEYTYDSGTNLFYLAFDDGRIMSWSKDTGLKDIASVDMQITAIAKHPDLALLLLANDEGEVMALHLDTLELQPFYSSDAANTSSITDIAFSHDSQTIAIAHQDGMLVVIDQNLSENSIRLYGDDNILNMIFSLDNTQLVTIAENGNLAIWNLTGETWVNRVCSIVYDEDVNCVADNPS